jgi:phosphoglycolate phosphatase
MSSLPTFAIFDLDGTLIDSQVGILESFRATLADFGSVASDDELKGLIGPPLNESFARLGFSGDLLDEVVDRYRDYYAESGVHGCHLYDGVLEMLTGLSSRGVRLGVATAKRVDFSNQILDELGIASLFETVSGANIDGTLSAKKEIVAEVLAFFQPDDQSDVWMVGDREMDVTASLFHGLIPIGVLWGYGSREELLSSGAEYLVDHPRELLDFARDYEGGDPVCWAHLLCEECGTVLGGTSEHHCKMGE